jgi:hypothetical protein
MTTRYISIWAEEIIEFAREKGFDVADLPNNQANRRELEGRLTKLNPELVFLNGHGDSEAVTGHDNEVLIKAADNHNVLKGRITYALSCKSGDILGRRVTEGNGATYIGYLNDFIFPFDNKYTAKPLLDPKARPFMRASNQVMVSLLKGHKAKDASARSKNVFEAQFTKLLSSSTDQDLLQSAKYLWWNGRNQVCLGNGEAKLQGQ